VTDSRKNIRAIKVTSINCTVNRHCRVHSKTDKTTLLRISLDHLIEAFLTIFLVVLEGIFNAFIDFVFVYSDFPHDLLSAFF
jgi:hypothetical protein